MCQFKGTEVTPGNIELRCTETGKKATIVTNFGWFCEDRCGFEEASRNAKLVGDMVHEVADMMHTPGPVTENERQRFDEIMTDFKEKIRSLGIIKEEEEDAETED